MRKAMKSSLVKWIVLFFTVIFTMGFTASLGSLLVVASGENDWATEDKAKQHIYENMCRNYAYFMITQSDLGYDALADGNLTYAVYRNDRQKIYSNNTSDVSRDYYDYQIQYTEGEGAYFNANSLFGTMFTYARSDGYRGDHVYKAAIQELVYDKDSQLFYWLTERGLYAVQNFYDEEWNLYTLNSAHNAYVCGDTLLRYDFEKSQESVIYFANAPLLPTEPETCYYKFEVVDCLEDLEAGVQAIDDTYWLLNENEVAYESAESAKKDSYTIYMKVAENPVKNATFQCGIADYFGYIPAVLDWLYGVIHFAAAIQIISTIGLLCGFLFLMAAAGHRPEDEEIHTRMADRVPLAIYTAFCLMVMGMAIAGNICLVDMIRNVGTGMFFALEIECAVLWIAMGLAYCMSLSVRIKSHTFWKYTLLHCLFIPFKKLHGALKRAWEASELHKSLRGKVALGFVVVSGIECLLLLMNLRAPGILFILFCFGKCVEIGLILYLLPQFLRIKDGGERIASGNYSTAIDTNHMLPEFKRHAQNINSVGDGIARAVEARIKSERFKTELITNVSHDIKTPLTSIINYVDLIKKENLTDATLVEYVDVLDRQSARLKKLIEDLMEASKASTGNLAVDLERCDATVMLGQIVGEYEEKFAKEELEVIVARPEEPVWIMADSRHLFRVYDNLMNNIYKYAQSGTRVYIDLVKADQKAMVTFRNTSKYRLNISAEELMERFTRGDSSRNTEGNGLGLNIAQSLMELMDGHMSVYVDGDLFKVELDFSVTD